MRHLSRAPVELELEVAQLPAGIEDSSQLATEGHIHTCHCLPGRHDRRQCRWPQVSKRQVELALLGRLGVGQGRLKARRGICHSKVRMQCTLKALESSIADMSAREGEHDADRCLVHLPSMELFDDPGTRLA